MRIVTARNAATSTTDGKLYLAPGLSGSFAQEPNPFGVTGNAVRPSRVIYKNRWYAAGFFSSPMTVTEARQFCIAGIAAPSTKPIVTTGTFSGGSTDELFIGYITFVHKFNDVVVHEGNPSTPSLTLTLNGTGRTWTNIPAVSLNPRVTHVRGYGSVDGDIPKFIWERQLGVTTVSENLKTEERGESLPSKAGVDGATVFDPNARGIPPAGPFVETYHDATWWSSYDHPNRVYPSRLFEPESVNVTEADQTWLETKDGEPITGLKRYGDTLIVACERAMYAIQGFSNLDYQIVKISNYYGCISNFSMVTLGPNSDLVFASQEGVIRYDGAFQETMNDTLRNYWRDQYAAAPDRYEACWAVEDRYQRGYKLFIPQVDNSSFYYFGHYDFLPRTGRYEWVFDRRNRQDSAAGQLLTGGTHNNDLYTGSCDGVIRKENVPTDAGDDGDTYGKAMTIVHKHLWADGTQAGNQAQGATVKNLDIYCKHEVTPITLSLYGGDDTASSAFEAQWTRTIQGTAVATPRPRVPLTSDQLVPSMVGGKGFALKVTAPTPVGVEWRGFGLLTTGGGQERPFA